jgi:hypothetical protein
MDIEIESIKAKYPRWYKIWTAFPGIIACWIILWITTGYMLFIFAWWSGAIFSIGALILVYYIWWLIRGCEYIVATSSALFELKKHERYNFNNVLWQPKTREEIVAAKKLPKDLKPEDVVHWCTIPMLNESPEILYETIEAIRFSNYDLSRVAVTIQGEASRKDCFEAALQKCMPLAQYFWYFGYTLHTLQPGEMVGKWANITYGAEQLHKEITQHFKVPASHVVVTTLDADNKVDKDYFSILTYTFLTTPDRKYASYQPVIFFFNNFWKAPFFSKIISLFNTFWILFNFTKKYWPRNFSSHAQPLDALIELGFWSKQTIVEDGHQYRRSLFGFKGKYECVPVYAKIYQDCNLSSTLWKTVKAQYNQMRRWAHGAQDIPYIRCEMIDQWKTISKSRVLFEFGRAIEWILLRSTLHIILLAWLAFSFLKDIQLSSYISLGSAISIFTNVAFVLTITSLLLSLAVFPYSGVKSKAERVRRMIVFLIYFFIFVGPSLITFSGLPALHTQIAIMLGKPMRKFNVTTKVR